VLLLENDFEMTNWAEVSASQMIEDDKYATDIEEPEADSRYYKSHGGIHEQSNPELLLEFWEGKHGDENKATKSVENQGPPISEVNTSIDSGSRDPLIRRATKRKDWKLKEWEGL
jgi:hypothetical protein